MEVCDGGLVGVELKRERRETLLQQLERVADLVGLSHEVNVVDKCIRHCSRLIGNAGEDGVDVEAEEEGAEGIALPYAV